ncbi:DUF1380 domain-containing protein [bacterium]|nr:DUF1380 domain-containing protein [bacterium]
MDAKPHRLRKWLLIVGGVILSIPILIFSICSIFIHLHSLRPDQMQPPTRLVNTSRTGASPLKRLKSPKPTFTDYLAAVNGDEAAALYEKWWAKVDPSAPVLNRKIGQPLSPADKQWLLDHRDMLDDLIRMTRQSATPLFTAEDFAALPAAERIKIRNPDYLKNQSLARLFAAEAERRRESGDLAGAAEALIAVNSIARTFNDASEIGHMLTVATQTIGARELSLWISRGKIPADVARRLQDQLPKSIVGIPELRRAVQFEYEYSRENMVRTLNSAMPDLLRTVMGNPKAGVLELMWSNPGRFTVSFATGMMAKANASTLIDGYDAMYATVFKSIDQNTPTGNITQKSHGIPLLPSYGVYNLDTFRAQTNTNVALMRLNMTGLNLSTGAAEPQTDPFNNEPLKTVSGDKSITIYSIGPDKVDQHAAIAYDPTNGTLSAGDMILTIPR